MKTKIVLPMKILKDCDLYPCNTMRLHSVAEVVYFPENRQELIELIKDFKLKGKSYYIFSGGSNIIFAERVKTPLICLMSLDKDIAHLPDGTVKVGCSVRVQTLIRDLQKNGLGGIEYLFSVPTSVGGAVYMNAGRGKSVGVTISDYLEEVEYYSPIDDEFRTYKKDAREFSHRHSPFQETEAVIISATFRFKQQDGEETERLILERMDHSKKHLSADKPSCGSAFCEGNRIVYRLLMGKRVGGAMYSKKTPDWISNMGDATASDVMALIEKGKRLHRLFLSKYRVEIKYVD